MGYSTSTDLLSLIEACGTYFQVNMYSLGFKMFDVPHPAQ